MKIYALKPRYINDNLKLLLIFVVDNNSFGIVATIYGGVSFEPEEKIVNAELFYEVYDLLKELKYFGVEYRDVIKAII